jgi:hypothetical protein
MTDYLSLLQTAKASSNPRGEMLKLELALESEVKKVLSFIATRFDLCSSTFSRLSCLIRDANLVYKSCGTLSRDDDLLIQLMCQRSKRQLEAADLAYRSIPQNTKRRSLSEKLGSEIGGNYGNFMKYLTMSRAVFNGQLSPYFLLN